MNFPLKFTLLTFFLFAASFTFSQTPEDFLQESSLLLAEEINAQSGNQTVVQQTGVGNEAEIVQKLTASEKINIAQLIQSGEFNLAIVRQEGQANKLALVQQGSNNYYELDMVGSNNNIGIVQDGNDNRIVQKINQVDGLNIELIQIGNDNEIIQVLEGNIENKELKIIQLPLDFYLIVVYHSQRYERGLLNHNIFSVYYLQSDGSK